MFQAELSAAGVRPRKMYHSLSKKKKKKHNPSHEKRGRRKKEDRIVSMY